MAKRRIMREIELIIQKETEGILLEMIDENDPFEFQGIIVGPSDTPFEGGYFKFWMKLPSDYPFRPPTFKFTTKIFGLKSIN